MENQNRVPYRQLLAALTLLTILLSSPAPSGGRAADVTSLTGNHPPSPGAVSFHTTTLSIPTYPYADHLTTGYNPTYNMTYPILDWKSYTAASPHPTSREYELLVLENDYLRVTLLPELGGRVYQMTFKPTGHDVLYQNPVIKPTHWGPPEQGWWLAIGGIEWGLPVDEHGYEWGQPWDYQVVTSTAGVTVTLRDTDAADRLRAAVAVHLPVGRAHLTITPRLENPTGSAISYKYWANGMLAPGPANTVGPDLHFVFDAAEMSVHSTGDDRLDCHSPSPTGPDCRFSWPLYQGVDFSRLGNWRQWLGFFEYPDAGSGPIEMAGAYDTAADEGVARIFPPDLAQGSKGFAFGWSEPIDWRQWTDDGSTYVELHGGVAPTFWDTAVLPAGGALAWTEYWYPVSGIGQLNTATAEAALGAREREADGLAYILIGLHTTAPHPAGSTTLYAWSRDDCTELARWTLPAIEPGTPLSASLIAPGHALADLALAYLDDAGVLLASLNPRDCLPPRSSVAPLPMWVATTTFTVTWSGQDVWTGVASYDVQVRDGYPGTWTTWLTDTAATSAPFTGVPGHTYFFRARARDASGNQEPYGESEWGQAFTTVLTEPAPVLVTSRKSAAPRLARPHQAISYTICVSNTGNLTASVALTDTHPARLVLLTGTVAGPPGFTLDDPGGLIYWRGDVAPGEAARITYALYLTTETPIGAGLTNTVTIAGGLEGELTRRATVVRAYPVWLPLVVGGWPRSSP